MPVYGLAESSLAVAFTPPGRGPLIDAIDRRRFKRDGEAKPIGPAGSEPPIRSASSPAGGRSPSRGAHRRRGRPAAGGAPQGRLQFRGPSATAGYFANPEATDDLVAPGGWRDSGDLGYLADGEVYLTGRRKDLIIRAGRNLHPHEVEDVVGDVEGVRRGCVAVFAMAAPGGSPPAADGAGGELVVVMAETRKGAAAEAAREALR